MEAKNRLTLLLIVCGLIVIVCWAEIVFRREKVNTQGGRSGVSTETHSAPQAEGAVTALLADLRSGSEKRVASAVEALGKMGAGIIPDIEPFLNDPETRLGVVEILTRLPVRAAAPVLLRALRNSMESDRRFRWFLIGGLGRLKAKEAVPVLETMYDIERKENPEGATTIGLAWALKEITGREYGLSYDPWMQGRG